MKRKRHSQLSTTTAPKVDGPPAIPMVPIDDIRTNLIYLFATLFNNLPNGIHTFASVSPSLEEISFSANRSGSDIMWEGDFDEFMDSLVGRMALTGQAILTVTSFPDSENHIHNGISRPSITIQGWHLSGNTKNPEAFSHSAMRKWYKAYGRSRPSCRIKFTRGYAL